MKLCRYCKGAAELKKKGDRGYPYERNYGPMWVCEPCKAWVGCHPGTENPLGGLANKELRELKMEAHRFFDPLWKKKIEKEGCSKGFARRAAYKWLAKQMGMNIKLCHIGYMNNEECKRVVEICSKFYKERPVQDMPYRVREAFDDSQDLPQ